MFPDAADKPGERRGFATGVGHESGFRLAGASRDNFRDE